MGNPSKWHNFKVWFWRALAGVLPRDVVYFVLIRTRDEVTADKWPDDNANRDVTLGSAISRWHAMGRK